MKCEGRCGDGSAAHVWPGAAQRAGAGLLQLRAGRVRLAIGRRVIFLRAALLLLIDNGKIAASKRVSLWPSARYDVVLCSGARRFACDTGRMRPLPAPRYRRGSTVTVALGSGTGGLLPARGERVAGVCVRESRGARRGGLFWKRAIREERNRRRRRQPLRLRPWRSQ